MELEDAGSDAGAWDAGDCTVMCGEGLACWPGGGGAYCVIGYGGLVVLTPADGATVAVSRSVVDVSAMLLPYGNLRPTPPRALSATVRRIGSLNSTSLFLNDAGLYVGAVPAVPGLSYSLDVVLPGLFDGGITIDTHTTFITQ